MNRLSLDEVAHVFAFDGEGDEDVDTLPGRADHDCAREPASPPPGFSVTNWL
ncbi:MAG: hypothetical protein M3O62_17805 [Pseudomonadota bacterium]|nr:hypothetical protein [Pseudomonadota bacterium]